MREDVVVNRITWILPKKYGYLDLLCASSQVTTQQKLERIVDNQPKPSNNQHWIAEKSSNTTEFVLRTDAKCKCRVSNICSSYHLPYRQPRRLVGAWRSQENHAPFLCKIFRTIRQEIEQRCQVKNNTLSVCKFQLPKACCNTAYNCRSPLSHMPFFA
jgi:hypothetical protein